MMDANTGMLIDPNTGLLVNQNTGEVIDPNALFGAPAHLPRPSTRPAPRAMETSPRSYTFH